MYPLHFFFLSGSYLLMLVILEFEDLYAEELMLAPDTAVEIMVTANQWGLGHLAALCERVLPTSLLV